MDYVNYIARLLPFMLEGTLVTLKLFFFTLLLALPLGIVVAVARLAKFKPLSILMQFYIWIFRGTPLLLQLLFVYFGLIPLGITIQRFPAALLTFVLNYAAYLAEIYRAGIQSIDKGQYEGAYVLGLSRWQTLSRIILPQTFKRVLPPVSNDVINLIKDTGLVYIIGLSELLRVSRTAVVRDFNLMPFVIAAVFYLFMTGFIQQFFKWLESKYDYYQ